MGSKITRKQTCHFVYPSIPWVEVRSVRSWKELAASRNLDPAQWFPGTLGASVLRHVPTYMDEVSKNNNQSTSEQKDQEDQSLIQSQSPAGCSPLPLHDLSLDPQSWDQRHRFIDPQYWIKHQVHSPAIGIRTYTCIGTLCMSLQTC